MLAIKESPTKTINGWQIVFGYDPAKIKGKPLTLDLLNSVNNQTPILVLYNAQHTAQLNQAGIEKIKQMDSTIELDKKGILSASALNRVLTQLISPESAKIAIQKASSLYTNRGYTTITEAEGLSEWLPLYDALTSDMNFPVDVIFDPDSITAKKRLDVIYQDNPRLYKGPMLLAIDSDLQSHSAYLTESYYQPDSDQGVPYKGRLLTNPQQIERQLTQAAKDNIPMAIESHGDAATDYVLNLIQKLQVSNKNFKPLIINTIYVRPDQLVRMNHLGVKVNWFAPQLFYWGENMCNETLGPERSNQIIPLSTANQILNHLSIHANAPAAPPVPLDIMRQISKRSIQTWHYPYNGHCPAILGEKEQITPYEALVALTLGAAELYGLQNDKGSLEVGKLADMTIFSEDPVNNLENTKVTGTITRGQIRWNGSALPQLLTA